MLSRRFVDRDMFMRYRGGGIGHKYMREVEVQHINMSLERDHWYCRPKTQAQNTSMDVNTNANSKEGPDDTIQPDEDEESDGGEYMPQETSDSSNEGPEDDDSEDNGETAGVEGDSEDLGSDAGYDSYGLADP
jgi:hypothetical protein